MWVGLQAFPCAWVSLQVHWVVCRGVVRFMLCSFVCDQAHMQLSEFEQSRHYLLKAGKLSPGNVEIRQELEKLNR